jgi:hypothetical protein
VWGTSTNGSVLWRKLKHAYDSYAKVAMAKYQTLCSFNTRKTHGEIQYRFIEIILN